MNATESNFNKWHLEKSDLKTIIESLKKVNNERIKEIEKIEK